MIPVAAVDALLTALVAIGVGAVAYARLRRHGTGGLLLASSLAPLATFLTGWQAFLNYCYFVAEMLLLAAMFCASRDVVSWAADA